MHSIFQRPLACISGLVSHRGSHETTSVICLYGHTSILHFPSDSTWHGLYVSINTSVWVYISSSGIQEQNIGWFTRGIYVMKGYFCYQKKQILLLIQCAHYLNCSLVYSLNHSTIFIGHLVYEGHCSNVVGDNDPSP